MLTETDFFHEPNPAWSGKISCICVCVGICLSKTSCIWLFAFACMCICKLRVRSRFSGGQIYACIYSCMYAWVCTCMHMCPVTHIFFCSHRRFVVSFLKFTLVYLLFNTGVFGPVSEFYPCLSFSEHRRFRIWPVCLPSRENREYKLCWSVSFWHRRFKFWPVL
jgi:hypothetical protein